MWRSDHPLWALGFRPFYLLASAFAALSVALWVLQYAGVIPAAIRGPVWHGHEMVFGYAIAVVAGFLFTAVRNWTGRPTPSGGTLAAIALLWVAGRASVFTPWPLAAGIVNALFPVAVAVGIGVPLVASGNRRNWFFIALLVGADAAVLCVHLSSLGIVPWPERAGLRVGLDIVLFIVAVVAGRVTPMFTNNGVPGAGATRRAWLETASLAAVLALLAADVLDVPWPWLAAVALAGAMLHAARLFLWHPWRTAGVPLVWILHAAYAWIPIHLGLRALAAMGLAPDPLATHALTIGVIGGMTIGMMTRTARGHTGLQLVAGTAEVTCYALVMIAALVRVFGPLLVPSAYVATVLVSGVCWSLAFAIYFFRYWPLLTRPRVDGKPG
ncbi:MAG TPA: NnrS family protein [Usitatibacter sp.]|nr:NnrS family protein [Usitatibacter sp.]